MTNVARGLRPERFARTRADLERVHVLYCRAGRPPHRGVLHAARHRPQERPAPRLLPPAQPADEAHSLANAIIEVKERITLCTVCQNTTDVDPCLRLRRRPTATATTICVVEEPLDILAMERTRGYHGLYHVLHGSISPMDGIGPEQLKVRELLEPPARRRRHRSDHGHQPQPRGRGDVDVRQPPPAARSASASRASPAACPWAATSSTPTTSRSRAPSKTARRWAPDAPERPPLQDRGDHPPPAQARRGRPFPHALHADARQARRESQGRPQDDEPSLRPPPAAHPLHACRSPRATPPMSLPASKRWRASATSTKTSTRSAAASTPPNSPTA